MITRTRVLAVLAMLGTVTLAAALPLLRNTIFYFWDDTAAAAVPQWRRIAETVLSGELPLFHVDMWRGGNFAAEMATGIWNPVVVLLAVGTYWIDNMALAITVAKTVFLLITSSGVYLLAREYQARPGLAAVVGTAMPLSGYSFFMDTTSWINALMVTAFLPWVWFTGRRALRRGGSLLWVVLAGYLCCSVGNPYGFLGAGLVFFALIVETLALRRRVMALGLAGAGIAVLLLNVMVFLPFLLTSSEGFRAATQVFNDEFFAPGLSDIATLSMPTGQPWITGFGLPHLTFPAMYLAWFVLPTVPWLRWGVLRTRWRSLVALGVFGGVVLLLVLGPSQIWMFRWPLRLITMLWLPVLLLWAVVAGAGFARDRIRLRGVLSGLLLFLGGYLAWSDLPIVLARILPGVIIVAGLVALLVWRGVNTRSGVAVLLSGMLVVLGMQLLFYPRNLGVANYQFPTSQQLLEQRFAKYQGVTVQIADFGTLEEHEQLPDRAYRDLLFGSMYSAAGVESLSAYSGIGFTRTDSHLCMLYQGSVCPEAWYTLWEPPPGGSVPLADLLRAETVVVQNSLLDTRSLPPPEGWRRDRAAEESGLATVWKRERPLPRPSGRVSSTSDSVRVTADVADGGTERVRFAKPAGRPGMLSFARLGWPGYSATVDGERVPLHRDGAGLLVAELPADARSGQLELVWRMPGWEAAAACAGLGILLTIALGVAPRLARRCRKGQA